MRASLFIGVFALGLSSLAAVLAGGTTVYAQNLSATVGYYPGALISLPALVANDQKFFEKNGLSVELVPIANGPGMTAAVASGSVTFVNNSWDNLAGRDRQGLADPRRRRLDGENAVRADRAQGSRSSASGGRLSRRNQGPPRQKLGGDRARRFRAFHVADALDGCRLQGQ